MSRSPKHVARRARAEGRRAKPEGVIGCEIWVKLGEPPVSESDLTFLGLDNGND